MEGELEHRLAPRVLATGETDGPVPLPGMCLFHISRTTVLEAFETLLFLMARQNL